MLRDATKKAGEAWSANTTLQEAGIDSFDLIEYIFAIEDTFGIHIDFNANKKGEFPKTIGDVAQLVARLRNEVAAS
jgi:acyl carrier protein